jgi:hypothetical protein
VQTLDIKARLHAAPAWCSHGEERALARVYAKTMDLKAIA